MTKILSSLSSPAASAKSANTVMKPAAKKPQRKAAHPATGEMVMAAIEALGDRGGSSLFAIKKYIALTYDIDIERHAIFIKKYLRSAVEAGILIQTAGRGASGSFKLPKNNSGSSKTKSERDHAEQDIGKNDTEKSNIKKAVQALKKADASKKAGVKKQVEQSPKETSSETSQPKNYSKVEKIKSTTDSKGPRAKKTVTPKAKNAKKPAVKN